MEETSILRVEKFDYEKVSKFSCETVHLENQEKGRIVQHAE